MELDDKIVRQLLKQIENMEFEQSIDGDMRHVRLVMPLVPGIKAMHVRGVEAQQIQLRFFLLTCAGICLTAGKKSIADELNKILAQLLAQFVEKPKDKPNLELVEEETPKEDLQ